MTITLGRAMSTAQMGHSLAEMIRQDKVHLISCTGAILEQDFFNLMVHDLDRVTGACIPEAKAMRGIEKAMIEAWITADRAGERLFPHEFFYRILREGKQAPYDHLDPQDSWMLAAAEKSLPLVVSGWEDSTLGNMYAAAVFRGEVKNVFTVRSGIEYLTWLAAHYEQEPRDRALGMFQIGGGGVGDFSDCVVPTLQRNSGREVRRWGCFCQISDSTTGYGGYSVAVPNEKNTRGKWVADTLKYVIESDPTLVAPLLFAQVLGGVNKSTALQGTTFMQSCLAKPQKPTDPRIAFFNHHAHRWDHDADHQARILKRLDGLREQIGLKPGQAVLEIGCGTGMITAWLAPWVRPGRVVAVDFSPAMLAEAKAKDIAAEFRLMDICAEYPPGECFDLAFCFQAFPHFREPPAALARIAHALKPGGRLVVLHLVSRHHINSFHRDVGGAVKEDLLPSAEDWPALLKNTGLGVSKYEDRPDLFLVEATRVETTVGKHP